MNVLWMSPSPNVTTGYGTVSRHVIKGLLKKKYNVKLLGLHNIGHNFDPRTFDFIDSDNVLPVGDVGNGQDVLFPYIKKYEIDVLITTMDIWQPGWNYIPEITKATGVKWIHMPTINSVPCPPVLKSAMKDTDVIVAPSRFVEKSLLDGGFERSKVIRIPHGVDTDIYKPFSEEKRQVIKSNAGYPGMFVFGSVMINKYMQKCWPELFFAYKIFLKETKAKETILHCHTKPNTNDGWNLQLVSEQYGMADKIYYTKGYNMNAGLKPEKMARLYNMMDVHVMSTQGESFGLPVLESMACGVPNIMTDCTTCDELVKKPRTGLAVNVSKKLTTPLISDQSFPSEYNMANQMIKLYKDKGMRDEMSKRAVSFAQTYKWDNILPMWCDLIDSCKDEVLDMIREEK